MDIVAREAVRGQAIEVIGAEVAVGNPRAQDVIRRDEDAVARGEGGLLLAAAVREAGVLRAEIGPPAAAGTPAALDQQRLEPAVALAGLTRLPLAGTLIVPGADAGPGGQMGGGGKATHVRADLGQDRLGGYPIHPGNALQVRHLLGHRSEEHTSELQSPCNLVCRLLLEKK